MRGREEEEWKRERERENTRRSIMTLEESVLDFSSVNLLLTHEYNTSPTLVAAGFRKSLMLSINTGR